MQEFLLIAIIIILFFGYVRRVIFSQSYHAFRKAADDLAKQKEAIERERKRKSQGKVFVDTNPDKSRLKDQGEYVDYEEVD